MALPDFPEQPSWTVVLIALSAPILTFIASYIKLKKQGINATNIEEIKDRARFRQTTLNRISDLEDQLAERDKTIGELRDELHEVRIEMVELKFQLQIANDRLSRR